MQENWHRFFSKHQKISDSFEGIVKERVIFIKLYMWKLFNIANKPYILCFQAAFMFIAYFKFSLWPLNMEIFHEKACFNKEKQFPLNPVK